MATATRSRSRSGKGSRATKGSRRKTVYDRLRAPMLWIAGIRIVLGIAAIPLAPFLYKEHFLVLVLMRPTKEVLLAGGFLARGDKVGLLELIMAAAPLTILGVWQFFALGRAYAKEIEAEKLPWVAKKILPHDKIERLRKGLKKKGARVILIGRLAVFPSALLAAAAGTSDMKSRDFLPADGIGGLLSMVEVIGAGYLFGAAFKDAGPWITGIGIAALLAMMAGLGWVAKRD